MSRKKRLRRNRKSKNKKNSTTNSRIGKSTNKNIMSKPSIWDIDLAPFKTGGNNIEKNSKIYKTLTKSTVDAPLKYIGLDMISFPKTWKISKEDRTISKNGLTFFFGELLSSDIKIIEPKEYIIHTSDRYTIKEVIEYVLEY